MKKQIHIVMKSTGSYEDRFESPVKAFTSKGKAEAYVSIKNEYFNNLRDRYEQIGDDTINNIERLFEEYLKDTNIDFYNECQKSKANYEEYIKTADNSDGFADSFNWDEYYDKQSEFDKNTELVEKYADKLGLTEKEKEDIRANREYNEYGYDEIPYFYVSPHILDLED